MEFFQGSMQNDVHEAVNVGNAERILSTFSFTFVSFS